MTITSRSDGRYQIKYHGKTFYGRTQTEVSQKVKDYKKVERLEAVSAGSVPTVFEYASSWLPVAKASVTARTYNAYASIIDTVCDTIGPLSMDSVTPTDIKSVYDKYIGKSDSMVKKAVMICTAMFASAVDDGIIARNPCKAKTSKAHKGTQGTHRNIEGWERELILSVSHKMQIPALIMLYAGLRRGEVLALRWEDIDLEAKEIHVNSSLRFIGNRPELVGTKTKAGTRIVPIFKRLEPFLTGGKGFICQSANGAQMTETAFHRAWESYMSALGDAHNGFTKRWRKDRVYEPVDIRCHDLRHSFCTMLCDSGVDMKLAMRWMGHSDEKMILRIYDHVTEDRISKAISAVNSEKTV